MIAAPAEFSAVPSPEPVDMARLQEITGGRAEDLNALIEMYVHLTSRQIEQLDTAVREASAHDIVRHAHSCAGASAACGMTAITPFLYDLERQAREGVLGNAQELLSRIRHEFERIRAFLSSGALSNIIR
jgi:HPt (histidine-containing phosphotransfer) domain-containing protein